MDDPTYLRNPAERISIREAIEAYTKNSAYQLFRENEIGSIAPGKQADFIIVDQDPLKVNPVRISDTKVLQTIIGGKTAYEG
jgi:predicted amidohydrolase YtcJ